MTKHILGILFLGLMACGEFEANTLHDDHPELTDADELVITEKGAYTKKWVWPTAEIPVCWESRPFYFAPHRSIVKKAVERTWSKAVALKFTGWNGCKRDSKGIRIRVADENPHTKGIGTQLDGKKDGMVLNFRFKNWCPDCAGNAAQMIDLIAIHEFGHALGLTHEQNRHDTPDTCEQPAQGPDGDTNVGRWDEHSVMNYCNPVYINGGELSDGDKATIRIAYRHLSGRRYRAHRPFYW